MRQAAPAGRCCWRRSSARSRRRCAGLVSVLNASAAGPRERPGCRAGQEGRERRGSAPGRACAPSADAPAVEREVIMVDAKRHDETTEQRRSRTAKDRGRLGSWRSSSRSRPQRARALRAREGPRGESSASPRPPRWPSCRAWWPAPRRRGRGRGEDRVRRRPRRAPARRRSRSSRSSAPSPVSASRRPRTSSKTPRSRSRRSVTKDEAEDIKKKIEEVGGVVEIK